MADMNNPEKVNEMYIKKNTLSTRINLHKYSVNKYGWNNWIFDQYKLTENMKLIEFGCGTGDIWSSKEKQLPQNISIILSDISPLMIEKVKDRLGANNYFSFQVTDIQKTVFKDKNFDIAIANHMLYHVANIENALSEIQRILKNSGYFYATTIGANHLKELQDIYRNYEGSVKFNYSSECSFLLENGEDILKKYFGQIEQKRYIDYIETTDIDAIMNYIVSYNKVSKEVFDEIYKKIKKEITEKGIFKIEKDSGIFICKK